MSVAIVSGGSKGLGRALSRELLVRGWSIVLDARNEEALASTAAVLDQTAGAGGVVALAGDITESSHRRRLVEAAESLGGLDLVVNNASTLGPIPMPSLSTYDLEALHLVFETNVFAPLGLIQESLRLLKGSPVPRILNVTSDASVEPYEGWGGYGSSKAALDHLSAILAVELPEIRVWAVDPGDMRTQMHQDAFFGEDISDRPLPEEVVPHLVALIESDTPSGRYRASEFSPVLEGATS